MAQTVESYLQEVADLGRFAGRDLGDAPGQFQDLCQVSVGADLVRLLRAME
ncbi:hypothetical protein KIH74_13245 [Kineosporia sp. J2-2]|uniref:Uncharacterized protein n=1 Tax=Kineosporia corallincola TaxID=2835133 RepID=A0ABS5TFQ0_9ACTN|nr:hypothetical protein [Kineosporia corallincola]MBT0769896.1 hypothetical protein [Kineosporia corallincola]